METTRIVRQSAVGRKEGRRMRRREGGKDRWREERRKGWREGGGTILRNYLKDFKLICNSRNVQMFL